MITVPYFVIPNVLQFVLLRRSKTTCDASERESYRQRALRVGDRKSGQLLLMGWAGKYDYYYYFRFLYNGFFQKLLQGRPSAPYVFQSTCGGWWWTSVYRPYSRSLSSNRQRQSSEGIAENTGLQNTFSSLPAWSVIYQYSDACSIVPDMVGGGHRVRYRVDSAVGLTSARSDQFRRCRGRSPPSLSLMRLTQLSPCVERAGAALAPSDRICRRRRPTFRRQRARGRPPAAWQPSDIFDVCRPPALARPASSVNWPTGRRSTVI